jgi:hypothetical protein
MPTKSADQWRKQGYQNIKYLIIDQPCLSLFLLLIFAHRRIWEYQGPVRADTSIMEVAFDAISYYKVRLRSRKARGPENKSP